MSTFKQALSLAADGALQSGSIGPEGHAAIAAIANGPSVNRARMAEHFAMHSLGLAPSVGTIDWLALIQQIQTLIPIIVSILNLFKPAPQPPVTL